MNMGSFALSSLATVLLLGACSGGGSGSTSNGNSSNGGSQGSTTGTVGNDASNPVCMRWKADRAHLQEGAWTGGNPSQCIAGDIATPGRANALTQINLYRYLANLPAVSSDPTFDSKAQQCALMVSISGLSHSPSASWPCYSADGAEAAAHSNEATLPAVSAVDLYMRDTGNSTTLGHRRWLLSNWLGPVGIGSTDVASCLWVIGGTGNSSNEWTAFPPAGAIPAEAAAMVDATGWSIQSNSIAFDSAVVRVTDNGVDKPVQTAVLLPSYGSTYALSMVPVGWSSQAGHTYRVSISGTSKPIVYDVQVLNCQ
ncbi:MAG TPA: CAP domain-containing protein [Burkholderiaceae bacterium]|nr:CAP domain-containing protein [Burkholderiaceae bacterium]